jgi:hypothetical protein
MDFNKLGQNEKLAVYGSLALIVGGVVGYTYGIGGLGILAALAMLVIIFLPQLSPGTNLPGSHGSLMVAAGGLAGIAMALALLSAFAGSILSNLDFRDIFFLIAVIGGFVMAWAGWQAFQAEGGKFQVGTASSGAAPSTRSAADPAPAAPDATVPTASDTAQATTDTAPSTYDSSGSAADAVDDRRPEA